MIKSLFLIGSMVLLFGCSSANLNSINSLTAKDCGADFRCFGDSLERCEPATLKFESSFLVSALIQYDIVGLDSNQCKIHQVMSNPETGNKNVEGYCWIKDYWQGYSIIQNDPLISKCTGSSPSEQVPSAGTVVRIQ